HLPQERARAIARCHQRAQAVGEVVDVARYLYRFEAHLAARPVFQRPPVDGMNLALRPHAPEKALSRFFAEPFSFEHLLQKRRGQKTLAPRILRDGYIKIA